jgi:hypothetical protein
LPQSPEVKASLLGVASNEILYRVDGAGLPSLVRGTAGPFSTPASSGSVNFTMNIPPLDSLVLSIQLNDASTHQALAIGATTLNMLTAPVTDVVVEMGSVTRNCYFVNEKTGLYGNNGSTYGFSTDTLNNALLTGGYDIGVSFDSSAYLFVDAQADSTGARSSIAYLGNGNYVDYDRTPPNNSYFFVNSGTAKQYAVSQNYASAAPTTELQVGDIYYVLLSTIPGAHAWIQVTDPGQYSANGGYGPSFRFRVNSNLPYYGYERTTADLDNTCSTTY